MRFLKPYQEIIGEKAVNRIYESATPLEGKHVVHINSTHYGGGVAEILNSLVYLMNDVGIKTGWRVIKASPDFFNITKKFHNALHGEEMRLSNVKKKLFLHYNERNSIITHIRNYDCVIVHDPQPLPLIKFYKKKKPWIWRFHLELSTPYKPVWNYLRNFVERYDAAIFSRKKYIPKLSIPSYVIPPSIDPFVEKNKPIKESKCKKMLRKRGLSFNRPILCQISRFDKWKDFQGVLKAFEIIQKKHRCQLVLLGNIADDDPEGQKVYDAVAQRTKNNEDVTLILENNDYLVNSLQRLSSVVFQKSFREGFGLTVSEALWKETPVIGSNVGGIPLQIIDGKTGYLIETPEQAAKRALKLLKNDRLRKRIGKAGKEHVRKNFLTTRHLQDYINLLKQKEIFEKMR